MRADQPLAQLTGGFVWRRAVERHQRGGDAWNPDDVGPPAILRDGGDLNQIWMSPDQFLEAMNGCDQGLEKAARFLMCGNVVNCTRTALGNKRSGVRKPVHTEADGGIRNELTEKKFRATVHPQEMHCSSTVFPQCSDLAGPHPRSPTRSHRGARAYQEQDAGGCGCLTGWRRPRTLERR